MVWCKVRMWRDERKRRRKKKSRNVQIESPSVRHVHEDGMMKKMLDEKCPVRDDERGRESESVQSFKNEVSMLCEKSQMQILWNPSE